MWATQFLFSKKRPFLFLKINLQKQQPKIYVKKQRQIFLLELNPCENWGPFYHILIIYSFAAFLCKRLERKLLTRSCFLTTVSDEISGKSVLGNRFLQGVMAYRNRAFIVRKFYVATVYNGYSSIVMCCGVLL